MNNQYQIDFAIIIKMNKIKKLGKRKMVKI